MRTLLLALTAATLWAQVVDPISSVALRDAAKPVEAWMGRALVVYGGSPAAPVAAQRARQFPQPFDAREAIVTPNAVYVSMAQMQAFRSSQELAEFLAHAAAHAKLDHPARMEEVMREVAILDTTHAPERVATTLEIRTRAEMEEATVPVAAEFMESAGCAPAGSCGMFGLLLRAARRP